MLSDGVWQANEPWRHEVRVRSDHRQADWVFIEYVGEKPPDDIQPGVYPIQVAELIEFTGPLIHNVLTSASCGLSELALVVDTHSEFLQALIQDFTHEGTHHTSIPIT